MIKPENEKKRIFRFSASALAKEEARKPCWKNHREFFRLSFPLGRFHFRKPVFRGEIVRIIHPNTGGDENDMAVGIPFELFETVTEGVAATKPSY